MANTLITPTIIAQEALMQLENNLVMGNQVHREYKKEFVKVGATVNIRKPVKFDVTDGAILSKQDVEEANTTIVVDQRKHVGWGFKTQDLTLTIEQFSERYIQPAMISLANKIDRDLCSLYDDVWNWVGTPGQTVNSFADFALAPQRLDEMAVPTPRMATLSPADFWAMTGNLTGLQIERPAEQAYRRGLLGNVAGFSMSMDQNIRAHTTGTFTTGSTPLVNGASQNVAYSAATQATWSQSLITDGWANSTLVLKAGDVFTLASVNAVNPVPGQTGTGKDDAGFLQQFVSLNDVTSDGSGNATFLISPPIITSGPYQTVTVAPANNAAIVPLGTEATAYKQNLAFHRNAFALVTVPLEMPDGVDFKARMTHKGISLRVLNDYDIVNDEDIIRIDVLYGKKSIFPDLATRVSGTA
jgi:hypothetical protein